MRTEIARTRLIHIKYMHYLVFPYTFLSLFNIPRKFKLKLEKIQREFPQGGGALEYKMDLVKRPTVCMGKNVYLCMGTRDQDIRCSSSLNKAFYASGVEDMQLKEKCFENRSRVANMGRKMEVSGLVNQETRMQRGYGKLTRRVGTPFIANLPSWYEIRGG